MKKIKITFICTNLSHGGAQSILYNLISNFDRAIYEPYVISLMNNEAYQDKFKSIAVPSYNLSMKPGYATIGDVMRLNKIVKSIEPNLIQGWMYHGNLAASIIGKLQRKPVFWGIHHALESLSSEKISTRILIRLSAYLSSSVENTIYVSHSSFNQHRTVGYSKINATVIPNGFDTSAFIPNTAKNRKLRESLSIPSESKVIGMIARYHPIKDHKTMLEATAILLRSHPDIVVLLCGNNIDQKNNAIMGLIQKLDIHQSVLLLGARDDIPEIVSALNILTLTSLSEAFPMVLGEAMAAGVPCISTDAGDAKYIIGDCGIIVKKRTPKDLADAWKKILDLPESDYSDLSKLNRSRITNLFSIESIANEYQALYKISVENY